MSINKTRSVLYAVAKMLGDVQAVQKAGRKRSIRPIIDRLARRGAGRIAGLILGSMFRGGR